VDRAISAEPAIVKIVFFVLYIFFSLNEPGSRGVAPRVSGNGRYRLQTTIITERGITL
jgi:hypothetical protein